MVAQSMIPGKIFKNRQVLSNLGIFSPSTIVYNCSDFNEENKFQDLVEKSAKALNIPGHEIIDKNGKKVKIFCSAPTKVNF